MEKLFSRFALLLLVSSACPAADEGNARYVGPETCALCHKEIAAAQQRTAMANTWQGRLTAWLPASFQASIADDLAYELKRSGDKFTYSVNDPGGPHIDLPVSIIMGGRRHGLGFLIPIQEVEGIPLARPTLIQARYAWSPEKNRLLIAPGCVATEPQSLESALGLALSPTFESRCLSCHGKPNALGSGKDGGVRCESCHGPGSRHVAASGTGNPRQGVQNPKRMTADDSIAVCAQCHVGLARFSDPSPDDLLVANQVVAIETSECFLQSRKAFSCTACHDPHNAAGDLQRTVNACLGCHTSGKNSHAAICPVNASGACTGCHMPSVDRGPLHLVDHLIRVHPEQETQPVKRSAELRTEVRPVSEYLSLIATDTREAAAAALDRISRGEPFYKVARETSVDSTAEIGGYLGRKVLTALDSELSEKAARLGYGETSGVVTSGVVTSGGRSVLLRRLPRDFKWDAEQVQRQAEELASRGDARGAIGKAQEALRIYPHYLRALGFIGTTFATSGNPKKAAAVFAAAARIYPSDAGTQFALGSTLESLGDREGAGKAYRRAISLDEDFTAAYMNLGMIAYSSGDWQRAIGIFRQGLQVDPMSAELYKDLGLALISSGDSAGASQAMSLARKLDLHGSSH